MPVKIRIKGNHETNEYKDAVCLKEIFESEFRNLPVEGEIIIINNATLFGQDTKDVDLIAVGKFDKYSTSIKTKSKLGDKTVLPQEQRRLFINDFCFVFETKKHRAEDIQLNGVTLLVRYNNKYHDVTTQSENQKYALAGYFKDRLGFSPYVCNFIWLRNVSSSTIKDLLGANPAIQDKHNYLPNIFSMKWLFQLACVQSVPFNPVNKETNAARDYCQFKSLYNKQEYDFGEIDRIFDLFTRVRDGAGDLTRRKIEQITKGLLKDQKYAQAIGEMLIVISGRAGTGKTIKLLTIACNLAEQKGARSLILTYNHALVSDIKRILALAGIPDGVDDFSVNISTLHKFFYQILVGFEIGTVRTKNEKLWIPDYLHNYEKLLQELYEYIENNLIGEKELTDLIKSNQQLITWDHVLIDEAQDWGETEKKILYFIFGKQKIIIADGIDQLIRSQRKCKWKQGLRKEVDYRQTNEKKGLRQKVDLVHFVLRIAAKLNVNWDLEPKEDLYGGKIVIKVGEYTKALHEREFKICKDNGNSAYEMMFLVPPSLVTRGKTIDEYNKEKETRSFVHADDFKEKGITVWDGTSTELRTEYAVNLDEHRLLQYESCRGLEGWVVVCLELDEFMKYKFQTFEDMPDDELALTTFEEKREKFVSIWTLIPLTRAIDTLVITIKNRDSKICHILREIYLANPDNMEWIDA